MAHVAGRQFRLAALAVWRFRLQEESAFRATRVISLSFLSAGSAWFSIVYSLELSTDLKIELMRRPHFRASCSRNGSIVLRLLDPHGRWFAILAASGWFDLLTLATRTRASHDLANFPPRGVRVSFEASDPQFRMHRSEHLSANAQMMYVQRATDMSPHNSGAANFTRDLTRITGQHQFTSTASLGHGSKLDMLNVKYLVFSALSPELEL